jgi:hypothetical protein
LQVLTDRAFLAEPKTMVKAFISGGIIAALFIFFFGFLGIFGSMVAVLQPWRQALRQLAHVYPFVHAHLDISFE